MLKNYGLSSDNVIQPPFFFAHSWPCLLFHGNAAHTQHMYYFPGATCTTMIPSIEAYHDQMKLACLFLMSIRMGAYVHMTVFYPCLPYTSQLPWRWIWHWCKPSWFCVLRGLMPQQFLWYCIVYQHVEGYDLHIRVRKLIFYEFLTRTPPTRAVCHSTQNQ